MKLGDTVMACPKLLTLAVEDGKKHYNPIPGTVVYIHPKGRFFVLEFLFGKNAVRESFFFRPEMEREIYENDCNHEREGWRRQDRHHRQYGHHFG